MRSTDNADMSQWHSIRPWIPRISLAVREITSVSATFILSPSQAEEIDPSLASLVEDDDFDDGPDHESTRERGDIPVPLISDVLSKGVTVKVNGSPWQRFIMRVDEEGEEAIIILYGLMPGRQYDVELGIAAGEDQLRGQVTTETNALADRTNSHTDSDAEPSSSSKQIASTTGTSTPPVSGSPPRTITVEEHAAQLQQTLNMVNSERDALNGQLKTARREAQKADASLRSEIEILKRASEKHANSEHRSKQKVLALQESVKQTLAAAQETETRAAEVEVLLPQLRARAKTMEAEHGKVQKAARKSHDKMEEALRADKKRTGDLQGELTVLTNRLEKLKGKKEKLTVDSIPELEQQLAALGKEIEEVEKDPYGYSLVDDPLSDEPAARYPAHPHLRGRYNTAAVRPTQPPIQRPTHTVSQSMSAAQPKAPPQKRNTNPPALSSTLSSRAPPFEPSQRLSNKLFVSSSKSSSSSSSSLHQSASSVSHPSGPFDAPGTRTILARQPKPIQRPQGTPGQSPPATPPAQASPPVTSAASLSPWASTGSSPGAAVRRVSPSRSNSGPHSVPPTSAPPYSKAVSTAVDNHR